MKQDEKKRLLAVIAAQDTKVIFFGIQFLRGPSMLYIIPHI